MSLDGTAQDSCHCMAPCFFLQSGHSGSYPGFSKMYGHGISKHGRDERPNHHPADLKFDQCVELCAHHCLPTTMSFSILVSHFMLVTVSECVVSI